MTVIDVRAPILRPSPAPLRDAGAAGRPDPPVRRSAKRKTREAAGSNGFERHGDTVSPRLGERPAIRRVP